MAQNQEVSGSWGLPLAVTVIGAFMAILDSSIVNVAIPHIMLVFGASTQSVQWIVTIYLLALGVVVPLSGWLSDRVGMKQLYIASLVVFTFGSALSAISPTLSFLIVARVIQAIGGGMIMPVTMSMVYRMVPRDRIGTAMGFWGLSLLLAPALGPTLGGYLVQYVDWRWIFTINIPIGILGSMAAFAWLPNFTHHPAGRLDWLGAISSATGLFFLLFAFTEGQAWGWGAESIVFFFYAAVVALGFFVVWELYGAKQPLLDLRVFRYGSYTASIIASVIINVGMFSALFFVPLFLQNLRGLSPFDTGLAMMPGALATGVMMPFAGRIYDRIGPVIPGVVGFVVMAYGTFLFHTMTATVPISLIVFWMIIRGLGMGLCMMPLMTGGMSVVPIAMIPRASAVQNIMQRIAGSFGIAIVTSVMLNQQGAYASQISSTLTAASPMAPSILAQGPNLLVQLWQEVQGLALIRAMDNVFVLAAALLLVAVIPVLFVRRHLNPDAEAAGLAMVE
ncbi:MAG: DHA2 family efflux MFS transporter permease subunit [Sulfobacillus sp.]